MSSYRISEPRRSSLGQVLAYACSFEKLSCLTNRRRRKDVARRFSRSIISSELLEARRVFEASEAETLRDEALVESEDTTSSDIVYWDPSFLASLNSTCSDPILLGCSGLDLSSLDITDDDHGDENPEATVDPNQDATTDAAAQGDAGVTGSEEAPSHTIVLASEDAGDLPVETLSVTDELLTTVREPLAAVAAVPLLAMQTSENGPSVSTVLTDSEATAPGSSFVLDTPPSEGTVNFESGGSAGQPSSNPVVTITAGGSSVSGSIQQDQNGNGVLDHYASDGRTGLLLFGDVARADWFVGGLGGTTRVINTGQFRGTAALATDVVQPSTGMRVSFRGGANQSLAGIDTLRFWVRSNAPMNLMVVAHQVDNTYPRVEIKNVGTGWQKVEIPVQQFGAYSNVIEYFLFSDRAGTFFVDEIALLGQVDGQTKVLPPNPEWGANLFYHSYWTSDAAFTDAMRSMRRWGPLEAPWLEPAFRNPLTADGVPREPAAAISYMDSYKPGIYQLRYEGTGDVQLKIADQRLGYSVRVIPGSQRKEGLDTVVELDVPITSTPMIIQLNATSATDPVRRIRLLAPGYHGTSQQTYTKEFLDRIRPFGVVRTMNYSRTNDAIATDWATRRLPTDSIQTTDTQETDEGGIAWEFVVDMANESGNTPWINIPHRATDNYIEELAKLWRDRLRPDSKLIVEFSNEIWNVFFTQYRELNNADYYGRVAPRLVKIREIFNRVWGSQANRVEVVLAGQAANRYYIDQALKYFTDNRIEPKSVISAISIALYATAERSQPYDQLEPLMQDVMNLDTERAQAATHGALADQYGLKLYAYEAGQHLQRYQVTSPTLFQTAMDDPRMGELIPRMHQIWREAGGDLIVYFTLSGVSTGTSDWGLLKTLSQPGSYKWDAMMNLLVGPGDANLDGRVDFDDFQRIVSNYGQTNRFFEQGDFDGDRLVGATDLRMWWEKLNDSLMTPIQYGEVNTFATQRGVLLPSGRMSLELSSTTLTEAAVGPAAQLTIRRTGSTAAAAFVQLTVDRTSEAKVATTIEIPAGASFVVIPIHTINDGLMDGNQVVKLTAKSATLRDAETQFTVVDAGIGLFESAWVGAIVFLDANGNGTLDSTEPQTRTDSTGQFLFSQVPVGTYRVRVVSDRTPTISIGSSSSQARITYTPSASLHSLAQGALRDIEFSYRVRQSSGALGEARWVRVTVTGENDLPEAPRTTVLAAEDGATIYTVLPANDIDDDDDRSSLSFRLLAAPTEGVVALQSNGTLSFSPGDAFQDLHDGESRTVTVTYRVTDSRGGFVDSSATIRVNGLNDEERIATNTGFALAASGGARVIDSTILATTDVEGDPITYVLTKFPQFGRLELKSAPGTGLNQFTQAQIDANQLVYQHTAGGNTADFFEFAANDGFGTASTGRVNISIPAAAAAPRTSVVGRYVFYNLSSFDNNTLAISLADSRAIATDKRALLPGEQASYANYTNYWRGLNGIMIDVANMPNPNGLKTTDFAFRVGNSSQASSFALAPWPRQIAVIPGAGVGGSDRLVVTWDDFRIQNQWLQVTLLANATTGLSANDVHFWGHSLGDTGNITTSTVADEADRELIRLNLSSGPVPITSPYDLNRDGIIDTIDRAIIRQMPQTLALIRPTLAVAAVAINIDQVFDDPELTQDPTSDQDLFRDSLSDEETVSVLPEFADILMSAELPSALDEGSSDTVFSGVLFGLELSDENGTTETVTEDAVDITLADIELMASNLL